VGHELRLNLVFLVYAIAAAACAIYEVGPIGWWVFCGFMFFEAILQPSLQRYITQKSQREHIPELDDGFDPRHR
jgi:hypothetical protein